MTFENSTAFSRILIALVVFALAATLPEAGIAQTDPMIGTWKLNLAKSTYSPGPALRSSTLTVQVAGQGQTFTFDGISAAGMPTKTVFTVVYDGQSRPATGSAVADASSIRRVNAYKMDYSLTKAGKEVQTGGIVLSTDGRTATFINTGVGANGQPISNVTVYEKQ